MITLRKIEPSDNDCVKSIIKTVMTELNCAGEGFSIQDQELDDMYQAYIQPKHVFYVLQEGSKVLGCGGIGTLPGEKTIGELKKMYFLPELRGKGASHILMPKLLSFAKSHFDELYIETMDHMKSALSVYEKYGFKQIESPLGKTGHHSCNTFYLLRFS